MALTGKQKAKVTGDVKRHEKDTGSPEYQVALFTEQKGEGKPKTGKIKVLDFATDY